MFGSFEKHVAQVHGLINEHIMQSFQYSIMVFKFHLLLYLFNLRWKLSLNFFFLKASHFETDYENRLGFGKYLDGIADSMWTDAVELIKYSGKRGASVAPLMEDSDTGLRLTEVTFFLNY